MSESGRDMLKERLKENISLSVHKTLSVKAFNDSEFSIGKIRIPANNNHNVLLNCCLTHKFKNNNKITHCNV